MKHKELSMPRSVLCILFIFSLCRMEAQNPYKQYLNLGYVSSFIVHETDLRPDQGFSIRYGIIKNKVSGVNRIGLYAGFLYFNKYNDPQKVDYSDRSRTGMLGINYRILKTGQMFWYIQPGLAIENFISKYSDHTESELSLKPELGILINRKNLNFYFGTQPSLPNIFIIGLGFSADIVGKKEKEPDEFDYLNWMP